MHIYCHTVLPSTIPLGSLTNDTEALVQPLGSRGCYLTHPGAKDAKGRSRGQCMLIIDVYWILLDTIGYYWILLDIIDHIDQ